MLKKSAPGLYALRDNTTLQEHNIKLIYGRIRNPNKNPVVDKVIVELHSEIVRQMPDGGLLTNATLATIASQLNSRIRQSSLSAWKIYNQRDQFAGNRKN